MQNPAASNASPHPPTFVFLAERKEYKNLFKGVRSVEVLVQVVT